MATSISSKFTAADRRKRVVTYGKSSRLESPLPPPTTESPVETAPSPERPRKNPGGTSVTTASKSLKKPGGALKASGTLGNTRATTTAPDIFDVPSDEDFGVPTVNKPKKKLVSKTAVTAKTATSEGYDIPASDDDICGPSIQRAKPTQPLRKSSQPPASVSRKLQKTAKIEIPPPDEPTAPQQRRGRTPQPTKKPEQPSKNATQPVRPVTKPKAGSRGTTPAPSAPPSSSTARKLKSTSTLPSKSVAVKPTVKQTSDTDIFDLPPSDDDAPLLSPKPTRPTPLARIRQPAKLGTSGASNGLTSPREIGESDDSNEQKKRKRQGAVATAPAPTESKERKRDRSVPQRNRKYQKKEDSVSPGHDADKRSETASPVEAEVAIPKVNKPKRTRLRTDPNKLRPAMVKGQSSPARLHNMLPVRPLSKPSPVAEVPEAAPVEDETMYDIPDPDTTPVPATRAAMSGMVTPRQKALFSSLLGNSSQASPSMPSISKLMLTDRKPGGDPVAGLRRSVSDISPSAPPRKSRLIDSLKQADETSEDEGSDSSEEDEEEEGEEDVTIIAAAAPTSKTSKHRRNGSTESHEQMEIDPEEAANSQASQTRVGLAANSKLTYAKQRSYLEEDNPEDALLLSMDIDDDLGFSSQKDVFSEDEEDQASQVRGIHDLRRQGQHQSFQWETESWIDDIANQSKSNTSIRRSGMMELATKMADEKFIAQLLDSALAHQVFKNIASNGEIIFDFAATAATLFILQTKPSYNVLDQLHSSNIIATLAKLLGSELDIQRIARDRKTNMSKMAQGTVSDFRKIVQDSPVWSSDKPDKVSPQLVALKALELLVLGLRKAGNSDALIDQETVAKLVDIASNACQRQRSEKGTPQDRMVLSIVLSVLETMSVSQQRLVIWPNQVLQRLADLLPIFFEFHQSAQIMLTVKLCMNLTNNKPKACKLFSGPEFIQPLVRTINDRFTLLGTELADEQRTEVREILILSLGAMINLAEFSDEARTNVVVDGDELIAALVQNFLQWSERAAQATSMEETQSTVAVGYLAVLLGNLCLNDDIRSKVQTRLPNQKMGMLIDKIKEFVRFHEHIDRKSKKHFEGDEGNATWQNYTARLMQVVSKLEDAERKS